MENEPRSASECPDEDDIQARKMHHDRRNTEGHYPERRWERSEQDQSHGDDPENWSYALSA